MPVLARIEGIGEGYAEKLAQAGIGSVRTLLSRGATRSGRQRIAKVSGVNAAKVLAFVNRADLFRVPGIGEEYSDLLEAGGVDSVPELAQRDAAHLCRALTKVNDRRQLVRRVPSQKEVERWIEQAARLPRVVTH